VDTNDNVKVYRLGKRAIINLITKEKHTSILKLADENKISYMNMRNKIRRNTRTYLHAESIRLVDNNLDTLIFIDRLPEIEGKVVYE